MSSGSISNSAIWAVVLAAMVARYRLTPPGTARQQIKFAMLGTAVWVVGSGMSGVLGALSRGSPGFMAAVWFNLLAKSLLGMGNVAFSAGLLLSLLRYRLYDAEALIGRSAAYAFITLVLGAVFAGSEKVIEVLGEELFGENMKAVSAGLGAATAAIVIAPLHGRIHHWTEHRFQKQLAALKKDLPQLVGDMREVATLDGLLAAISSRLERGVRATFAAVVLTGEGDTDVVRTSGIAEEEVDRWRQIWRPRPEAALDCDRADPMFPMRVRLLVEGAVIGWVLLGHRPDGSFYSKDEREALAQVADPIARAVWVVQQRDARRAEYKVRDEALERRLAQLESHLINDFVGTPKTRLR